MGGLFNISMVYVGVEESHRHKSTYVGLLTTTEHSTETGLMQNISFISFVFSQTLVKALITAL